MEIWTDQLWLCDCEEGLKLLPNGIVPITITSPAWDQMYEYGGHVWNWKKFMAVADQLYRVTADGGVVCWDVADSIANGFLSGTPARQTCYFLDIGFKLFEEITVHLNRYFPRGYRHGRPAERVLVFSKGNPRTFHRLTKPNKCAGQKCTVSKRKPNGSVYRYSFKVQPVGLRQTLWCYTPNFEETDDNIKRYFARPRQLGHPTPMCDALARDLIEAYSERGDLVLDPFAGSATTLIQALLLNRAYLGMEIHQPYFEEAQGLLNLAWEEWIAA